MHHRKHHGGTGLHQTAIIDVALCDHAVERRDDPLIGLLLAEHLDLRLLGDNIGLGDAHRGLLRCKGQPVVIALLQRQPALFYEARVASIGHPREFAAGLGSGANVAWYCVSVACACEI